MSEGQGAPVRLSATVLARDEEDRLAGCLASLSFCDEVVVVDNGSRDRTGAVAAAAGARVVASGLEDFIALHEFARGQARGEWVLCVDADERVTPELAREVREAIDRRGAPDAYSVPFKNYWRGFWLRHGGLWPDRHARLYRRDRCRFDPDRPVHQRLLIPGSAGRLEAHIVHHPWRSLAHLVEKTLRYAEVWALAQQAHGRRAGALDVAVRPAWRFVRGYILHLGFLDGVPGAIIAFSRAYEAFYRYARLWELSRCADSGKDRLR